MKKLILGILIGSTVTLSATAGAEAIKQYILTDATYPIVVNGNEYKDAASPILNYEGSTYVPLAKLGDLTGVNYKWNEALKRVEIVTGNTTAPKAVVSDSSQIVNITKPAAKNDMELKGLVLEGGATVLYAYDKYGKYKGKFTDADNVELVKALANKSSVLPPSFTEGWIGLDLLSKIYDGAIVQSENNMLILKAAPSAAKQEEILRLTLPDGWRNTESGEGVVGDMRFKAVNNITYLNIADLQKAGKLK
jgi:hypothetical protein